MIYMRTFESLEAFHLQAFSILREALQVSLPHPHAVLLSGGNTPLPIYGAIAQHPFPIAQTLHIAYTDERHVNMESPDSNFGNSSPMLASLGIPAEHVMRVRTELPLEQAAGQYHNTLNMFLQSGGVLPLGLLGIGSDGHTCSIFADHDLHLDDTLLAAPVYRHATPHRITVTPHLLKQVKRIIFLVTGNEKTEIVDRLLHAPDTVIAGKAVAHCPHVELWRA
ncbi:MAG TPA: 6-phosphogluconolactonase [Candidatus Hydrogenedentes bacterium]|nr:6-phosphogluconolactonase [Candidatus Hydrogenedentota bacterium]